MIYDLTILDAAHRHAAANAREIELSAVCGCFYCCTSYGAAEVDRYLADGTAVCPHCAIDSVLGDASGLPIEAPGFLTAMHERWFERFLPIEAALAPPPSPALPPSRGKGES